MFRTTCVHQQEDLCTCSFCMVRFSRTYISSPAQPSTCMTAYINAWKTYHTKLHVQMVFLMKNTWCSKHVEDNKNWMKTLIWKVCILLVYITVSKYIINKMTSLQVLHNSHFLVSDSVHFKHRSYVCIMKLVLTIRGKQKAYRTAVCNS